MISWKRSYRKERKIAIHPGRLDQRIGERGCVSRHSHGVYVPTEFGAGTFDTFTYFPA